MRKHSAAAILAVVSTLGLAAAVQAQTPVTTVPSDAAPQSAARVTQSFRGFNRYDVDTLTNRQRPQVVDPNRVVSATVQIAGDSVTTQRTKAASTQRGFDPRAADRAVRASQDKLIPTLQANGAVVTGRITQVLNGVRVKVKVGDLAKLSATPGVVKVQVSKTYTLANGQADVYSKATQAWQDLGVTGAGLTIGIIDDGIDYYHADFGGVDGAVKYAADDGTAIEPGTFPTAKVVGGYDFVGDAYDAGADAPGETDIPAPDDDPLACGEHGTHVAGTAAGSGVLADGSTFAGPYNATTISDNNFTVAPGSAPQASIRAYKVFGCDGSVNDDIIIAAIDRAVADGVSVINMSLGSPFGTADSLEASAIDAATAAGVLIVASAGNEGPNAYMTGAPATSDRALSVAANDASFPTITPVLVTGSVTDNAGNSNLYSFAGTTITGELVNVGLGCADTDFAGVTGKIAVATRGVCARTERAVFGQAAGAIAVILINNAAGLPPVEGAIAGVTIPFIGVGGTVGATYLAAAATPGNSISITEGAPIANPAYGALASFSSGGPRRLDSGIKPDVAAPGVAVLSAFVGTGNGSVRLSGTSMSSPHTAGIAILVRQAHPTWGPMQIKAAIQNTADPSIVVGYNARTAGTGAVNARRAVDTIAYAATPTGRNNVSFGFRQVTYGVWSTRSYRIYNTGTAPITYDIAPEYNGDSLGSQIEVYPSAVTVPPGKSRSISVRMYFSQASGAALPSVGDISPTSVLSVQGAIVATPRAAATGVYTLRTAFNMVPQGTSDIRTWRSSQRSTTANIKLRNYGSHTGTADQYQWILSDAAGDALSPETADITDIGVQSFPADLVLGDPSFAGDSLMIVAVNTAASTSTQATHVFDGYLDNNNDGIPEFEVLVVDSGLVFGNPPTGLLVAYVIDLGSSQIVDLWSATAATNGSTVLFPVLASSVGVTSTSGVFGLSMFGSSVVENGVPDGTVAGLYNPFAPAVSVGGYETLAPFSGPVPMPGLVDVPQATIQQPLGWLIISVDDAGGIREGERVKIKLNP